MAVGKTAPSTHAASRWAHLSALVGVIFTVVAALVAGGAGGPEMTRAICAWGMLAGAGAASAACVWRARGFQGRARWGWAVLATGLGLWGLSQFAWLTQWPVPETPQRLFSLVGVPSVIGLVVLIPAGLLILPSASQPLVNRLRSLLDGLLIAASLVLIAWVFVMGPYLKSDAHGENFYWTLVFPLADIVLVTMVGYMLPRQRRHRRGSDLAFFGGGMVAFACADIGHIYLELIRDHGAAPLVHIVSLAGYALIIVGAIRPRDGFEAAPTDLPLGAWSIAVMVPHLAVLAALASSVMFHVRTGHSDPFVAYTRSFLILLIVGRQLLTQLQNRALTRNLESRVAERTAELNAREQWFHALIQHSSDVITVIGADGVIRYQSESMQRVFGYPPEVFVGKRYTGLLEPDVAVRLAQAIRQVAARPFDSTTLELVHTHADGRKLPSEVIVTNLVDDPHVAGFVLNTRDISERKELQDQLVHEAYHDSLTQLGNRALFRDRTAAALSRSGDVTVLHFDLDSFKRVNDSLGHLAGDQLLVQVADRIKACVRDEDVVARLGADEFAILAEGADDAENIARRILDDLEAPIQAGARLIHVRASIGLAAATLLTEADGESATERADQLIRNADLAMNHAKTIGGGVFTSYRSQMRVGLVERLELESDLRGALERGELRLHYQPTIDLATSEVVGFEALARWPHPTRGMINPLDFIPIAEATGLIVPLGRWVLHEACRQAVEWSDASGGRPLKMSVNVSVRQFDRADLAETVAEVLAETGMPADRLCLEMTESVLMTDTEANLEQLLRLKALGLTLAIDDFGTGYSSLAYLRRFPVDTLKIDRSFVERLGVIADDTALTDTIVRLGKSLGMATVAEGIEEFGQLAALREMGCGFAQGYYFSRPVPAAEAGRIFIEGAEPPALLATAEAPV